MVDINIATDDKNLFNYIHKILTSYGYRVIGNSTSAVQLIRDIRLRQVDMVILDTQIPGFSLYEVVDIMRMEGITLIILTNSWHASLSEMTRSGSISSVIIKPITENNLIPGIETALAVSKQIKKLRDEIESLKRKMESRKAVEKAKGILMEEMGLSEKEAFKKIQKESMNNSMSMKAVAEAIINNYKFFK